jgi:hypothetical protein
MTAIRVVQLGDPEVEFGDGKSARIKEGLARFGPYSTKLGAAHPRVVRVGIVGTKISAAGALAFFQRCTAPIPSGRPKALLAPDFPGFAEAYRSALALDPMWVWTVKDDDVDEALKQSAPEAFQRCLRYWTDGVEQLASRDVRPDVVVCALPGDVLAACRLVRLPRPGRVVKQSRRSVRQEKGAARPE